MLDIMTNVQIVLQG